jgi:uncharacterized OsmC-like protein
MKLKIDYQNGMQFQISDTRGHCIISDQPASGGGEDKGMTPVELMNAALGACVGVYVVNFIKRRGIETQGLTIAVDWEKANDPTRVSKIKVQVDFPQGFPSNLEYSIKRVAEGCTVHNTLHGNPEIEISLSGKMEG